MSTGVVLRHEITFSDVGRESSHNWVSEEAVYIVSKHRRLLAIAEAVYRAADVHFVVTIVSSSNDKSIQ